MLVSQVRAQSRCPLTVHSGGGGDEGTHTWFSPLGDRNHAPKLMQATTNRPIKMLHLQIRPLLAHQLSANSCTLYLVFLRLNQS